MSEGRNEKRMLQEDNDLFRQGNVRLKFDIIEKPTCYNKSVFPVTMKHLDAMKEQIQYKNVEINQNQIPV